MGIKGHNLAIFPYDSPLTDTNNEAINYTTMHTNNLIIAFWFVIATISLEHSCMHINNIYSSLFIFPDHLRRNYQRHEPG